MPDEQRVANNSQTYVVSADDFAFEALEQENGQATVIKFKLEDPKYHAGDVLVVLSGSEIHFHGMRSSWFPAPSDGSINLNERNR